MGVVSVKPWAGSTVSVQVWLPWRSAIWPARLVSTTSMVKVYVPVEVGVPLSSPVAGSSDSHDGRVLPAARL